MTRPRNTVSRTGTANAAESVTNTAKKKLISGSDATRLHRRVMTECGDDFRLNLELPRDKTSFFQKPKNDLAIDREISWLLNQNDENLPRILRSTIIEKRVECPYVSMRENIITAVSMAYDALETVVKEEEKYCRAKILLEDLSGMEKIWNKIAKTNPYDLTPYRKKFGSGDDWNLEGVYNSFDALKLAISGIDEIRTKAASLVNERRDIYEKGGAPGHIWHKAFATYITLCWRSLTREDLVENKHIGYLEEFISASFKSIYEAFEKSPYRYDKNHKDRYVNFDLNPPRLKWGTHARSACKTAAEWDAHLSAQAALPDDGREPTHVRIFNTPLGRPGFTSQGAVSADARARDALAIFDAAGTAEEKNRAAFDFLVSFSINLLSEEGQKIANNIRRGIFFGHFFYILDPPKDSEMS